MVRIKPEVFQRVLKGLSKSKAPTEGGTFTYSLPGTNYEGRVSPDAYHEVQDGFTKFKGFLSFVDGKPELELTAVGRKAPPKRSENETEDEAPPKDPMNSINLTNQQSEKLKHMRDMHKERRNKKLS